MKVQSEKLGALPSLQHAFFTREGGVSGDLYNSLNCGLGSKDRPEDVLENRRRVAEALGLSKDCLVSPYQTHSSRAITVTKPWDRENTPEGDALVTDQPGIAIAITTADCSPVLFADREAGVIGAAHAGWRGALSGILEATLEAMTALGARTQGITAAIGPAIEQPSYEVGAEFPGPFLDQDPANQMFFVPGRREGHFQFDIKGYCRRRLVLAGLEQIETLAADTCADETRFFSYRRSCLRQEADYGRSLSAITLET